MLQKQKGSKTVCIHSRTFGGYRLFLYNAYYDSQEELYFESLEQAEDYANIWLTSD